MIPVFIDEKKISLYTRNIISYIHLKNKEIFFRSDTVNNVIKSYVIKSENV